MQVPTLCKEREGEAIRKSRQRGYPLLGDGWEELHGPTAYALHIRVKRVAQARRSFWFTH